MPTEPANVTLLLHAASSGDRRDLDRLMTAIYGDLRRLALVHMRAEHATHTLQPTALVHEAYVRLLDQHQREWKSRVHFFALAARIIRRILIDHARERQALKRGGAAARVPLEPDCMTALPRDLDLLALDEALEELAKLNEQQARIVELRFFGGCNVDEIADLLGIASRTVDRHWRAARAWLWSRLEDDIDTSPLASMPHAIDLEERPLRRGA
ncbi:MAG: sigma-70 family RNA polymerase sigma factor [Phycisphaerae bacterium]|nr:sigma-70 family RNA polymerase sigma factor [Phycisphaerae bacterium]